MSRDANDSSLRFATAMIADPKRDDPGGVLAAAIGAQLDDGPVDVAILLASRSFRPRLQRLALDVHEKLGPRCLIGVSAESVIAGPREYENQPAVVLWAGRLGGAQVSAFHLSQDDLERLDHADELCELIGAAPDDAPSFIVLADPYTIDAHDLLDRLAAAYPHRPVVGGMASGGTRAGENAVVFEGQTLRHGAVGLAIAGDAVRMRTIVSQGCRPIGQPMIITRADGQIVYQLGGRPALDAAQQMVEQCTQHEAHLIRRGGLFVGRVINEQQGRFARGDFLIRNCLGFDRESRAMAVADLLRTGQTIQFHVRDAESAHDDLVSMLRMQARGPTAGGLLFVCNGRGSSLFGEPDHDARLVSEHIRGAALAGCFCAGEFGPVGGQNFLHGHTAVAALFEPAEAHGA